MFDFDNENRAVIRFSHETFDANGNTVSRVERIIRDDEAEYLPEILNAFRLFLQGMTFTYVNNVIATSDNGNEHSADDIF